MQESDVDAVADGVVAGYMAINGRSRVVPVDEARQRIAAYYDREDFAKGGSPGLRNWEYVAALAAWLFLGSVWPDRVRHLLLRGMFGDRWCRHGDCSHIFGEL